MRSIHGIRATLDRNESLKGLMFIAPSLVGFILFYFFPLIMTAVLSFCKWDMVSGFGGIEFTGLKNYTELFNDVWFKDSFRNNFLYAFLTLPLNIVLGMLFAVLIDKHCYKKNIFRMIYFLPYISSIVAVATVWMVLFQPSFGPVNSILGSLGIENPPKWLGDTKWALPTIAMMQVWQITGYYIVVYIAGLQGIPSTLYEAADIDGAGWFQKLRGITIPMLTPTTFFLTVTGIITSFKVFDVIQVLTQGGPGRATTVLVYYLYKVSFTFYKMGYGSTVAMVLFIVIFIITYVQWKGQEKWVNYM